MTFPYEDFIDLCDIRDPLESILSQGLTSITASINEAMK